MLRTLRVFLAVFVVAARRLWAMRGLSLAAAIGYAAAIILAFSVPLYADAVYHRMLERELSVGRRVMYPFPPFAFRFHFNTQGQETSWERVLAADQYLTRELPVRVALPRTDLIRYFQTTILPVFSFTVKDVGELDKPIMRTSITAISDFGEHVQLVEGRFPAEVTNPAPASGPVPPIEVLVSKRMADATGMRPGDRYAVLSEQNLKNMVSVPLVVTGVWEPRDPQEQFWSLFYQAYALEPMFLTSESAFYQVVGPRLSSKIGQVIWYSNFNGDSVRVWNVLDLVDRIDALEPEIGARQLNITPGTSPKDGLLAYRAGSQALTAKLYAFSVPLFVLILAFTVLVSGLSAASQRNEIAVLRSRGAAAWQIVGMTLLGTCVLAALALLAGAPLSMDLVQLIGRTRSFLSFVPGQALPVAITPSALPFGLVTAALILIVTLVPIAATARLTITTYKQEQARTLKPPWWQRAGLDILLLIPAGYWTAMLFKQGTLDIAGASLNPGGDPFSNPSLFLVPGIAILGAALACMRLAPLFLRLLASVLGRLPGTGLVLAVRELARSPGLYITPLLLLVLTLAQATYTASVAATLDLALDQQTNYDVGADVRFRQIGVDTQEADSAAPPGGLQPAPAAAPQDSQRWIFQPITEYYRVPGVRAVARAGSYPVLIGTGSSAAERVQFMGIDAADFPRVAYWRRDFAGQPLGGLMNALSSAPNAVLVSESALARHGYHIGDPVHVTVGLPDASLGLDLQIAGTFKLWPTWYPNQAGAEELYVGNLDYVFEKFGSQAPHDLWVRVNPGYDPQEVASNIRGVDFSANSAIVTQAVIEREQTRPERQGLLGILSIGFGASLLLTVLGFTLYTVFSLRRRTIGLGVLRALGLSRRQMIYYLGCELGLLLGMGLAGGTAIGLLASLVYIPFLQVNATDSQRTLPFSVVINWPPLYGAYALSALLFGSAIIALLVVMRRLNVYQAVKLGETL